MDQYIAIVALAPEKYQPIAAYNKRLEDTHNKLDLKFIDAAKIYRIDDQKIGGTEGGTFTGDIIVIC